MKSGRAKKFIVMIAAAALMAVTFAMTAFAGTWRQDSTGWRYTQDNGGDVVNSWVKDGGYWYRMGSNGYMKTGWYQDTDGKWYLLDNRAGGPEGHMLTGWQWVDGHWYYLNASSTGTEGAMKTGWFQDVDGKWYLLDNTVGGSEGQMLTGWQWVNGYCYYLDPANGGAMTASGVTPDGYTVDANGRWTENGVPKYDASKIKMTNSTDTSGSGRTYTSWELNYNDPYVSGLTNNFNTGNYGMMTSSEKTAVDKAIEEFKDKYIDDDMTAFQKEMAIIQWIVETCEYAQTQTSGRGNSTAYSVMVNHSAQCGGYADAFLQMAKACGLDVRYVYNNSHAWNLIKLDDGRWYHVDVTWEDPADSRNNYGFGNLMNSYINLTDDEMRSLRSHTVWYPETEIIAKCTATQYGHDAVEEYINYGQPYAEFGKSFRNWEKDLKESLDNNKDVLVVEYSNSSQAADEIIEYLEERIEGRKSNYEILVRYPHKYRTTDSGSYAALIDLTQKVSENVSSKINSEYDDILSKTISISFVPFGGSDYYYFSYNPGTLSYAESALATETVNLPDLSPVSKVNYSTVSNVRTNQDLLWGSAIRFFGSGAYAEFYTGGKYNELTFTYAPAQGFDSSSEYVIEVYGDDNKVLWTSDVINYKSKSADVVVDISGQKYVKIYVSGIEGADFQNIYLRSAQFK